MATTWVIIASASEAFFYELNKKAFSKGKIQLNLVASYSHPESRKKDGELMSDRSGHYRNDVMGHGSFINPTEPKKYEAEFFAKEITDALDIARTTNDFDSLVLITPPHFLGLLNKHMNKNVQNLIHTKIEKDYTKTPNKALVEYLERHLLKSE